MSAWTPLSQWPEFAGLGIPSAPPESAHAASVQPMPAWERGSSIGNYFGTIKDVALNPVQTFDNLPAQGGFGRPLLYNYLTTFPALFLLAALYAVIIAVMGEGIMEGMRGDASIPQFLQNLSVGGLVGLLFGFVFCLALFAPLGLFVSSAFTYCLLLPWSPRGGYAGSFRANAYVNGAFFPLTCIPCRITSRRRGRWSSTSSPYPASIRSLGGRCCSRSWSSLVASVAVFTPRSSFPPSAGCVEL
jgi:hypothetical protein